MSWSLRRRSSVASALAPFAERRTYTQRNRPSTTITGTTDDAHPGARGERAPAFPRVAVPTRGPSRRHHAALRRLVARRLGRRVVLRSTLHEWLHLVGA